MRAIVTVLMGAALAAPVAADDDVLRSAATTAATQYEFSAEDQSLLEAIQRGCFNYLWYEVGAPGKLPKHRRTTVGASTAGIGFQLSSLPIGVERGWITREEGERRALTVLQTLRRRRDNRREGVFLHFVHADTGAIYPEYRNEAATVDHALLLAGALPAATYFGGEVAALVDRMAAETNWRDYYDDERQLINFGWEPVDHGNLHGTGRYYPSTWHVASDEERLVYFIAVGCPTAEFAADPRDYYRLERHVKQHADDQPFVVSPTGSLFTYFFSHCWIDYRSLGADDPGRFGVDGP
ncbi:MAG TPA: glucoamylase family protein, partial [Lacipirellulaceae bacterium]|nr:glucoamylase family protein [Lacipirellulaceae bacterium]